MDPRNLQSLCKRGPQTGRAKPAEHATVRPDTQLFKDENVLHGYPLLGVPDHLGDIRYSTHAVAEPGHLNNNGDCGCDLLTYGPVRQVKLRHQGQRFETRNRIAWSIRMNGGQGTVMTRAHGLQHVQRFAAANLANHDAVRAHTKSVDYQFTLTNRALALHVRRTAFQSDNVMLLHL